MPVLSLLLLAASLSSAEPSRAKVVEDYVVSANLDENNHFPQLHQRSQLRDLYRYDAADAPPDPTPPVDHPIHLLQDRDLLLHHPPPPHPPHPPPPLALYAPSFFAIGLIAFLILLNSLQTSLLLVLKSKGSLLGSVTGALGRRKRFAPEAHLTLDGASLGTHPHPFRLLKTH